MRFPSITPYIEAIANLGDRLRTHKDLTPVLDKSGEPIFYSSKGVVNFMVESSGVISTMRCFTSVAGYERLNSLRQAGIINADQFENELLVFTSGEIGDYYTFFLDHNTPKTQRDHTLTTRNHYEGLIPFEKNGLWGYNDSDGVLLIEPQYSSASEFGEGRAVVGINGLYGLIDTDGKLILKIEYDEISWDESALAYVDRGGRWGCFDRLGRQVVDCKYNWIGEFSQSLVLVKSGGKYGYINLLGEEVIPLVYDWATSFDDNGIASVTICGEPFVINKQGEVEIQQKS